MLHLIYGRAGYGKTQYIYEKISKTQEGVILLVPEQISFETERDMLGVLGASGMSRVQVLSFSRLCNRFFTQYGGKNLRCIDSTGKTALLGDAINAVSGELELFSRGKNERVFRESLLSLFEQLKRSVTPPEQLMQLSAQCGGTLKRKLYELALICAEYNRSIQDVYYDPLDDLTKMARMLPNCRFFEQKTVFIDAFFGYTPQQLLVLEQIIGMAKDCYITLGYDGIGTEHNDMALFANVDKTARQLVNFAKNSGVDVAPGVFLDTPHRTAVPELQALERNLFAPDYQPYEQPAPAVCVCGAAGISEETDFAARQIHRLVRENGLRYRDISVISGDIKRYKTAFASSARRYGIPCFIDDRQEAAGCAIFRTAMYALTAANGTLSNDDIISLLGCGICFLNAEQTAQLYDYTALWMITGEQWEKPFTGGVSGLDNPGEDDEIQLEQLNLLRERLIKPLKSLQSALRQGGAQRISRALYDFIIQMGCDKGLAELCERLTALGESENAQTQRQSYEQFIRIISQLAISLEGKDVSGAQYYEYLCRAVDETDIGALPQGLDEVAVGSASRMRPRSPRVTFILGANDGVFPQVLRVQGLLSEHELQTLEQNGVSLPYYNEQRAVDEQYLAYAAACSASERLYISYLSAESSGAPAMPSSLVSAVMEVLPGCTKTTAALCDISDIECECDLSEFLARNTQPSAERSSVLSVLNSLSPERAQSLGIRRREHSISQNTATALFHQNINSSASKIDCFYECKYRFFCQYGLRVSAERSVQVDTLQKGTTIHYVMQRLVESYDPAELKNTDDEQLYQIIFKLVCEQLQFITESRSLSRIEQYNLDSITTGLTAAARRIFNELAESDFKAYSCELEVGGNAVPRLEVALPDGGKVSISGKIDRVDISQDGSLMRILDYKSSAKALNINDVRRGQSLQMLIYMVALRHADDFADKLPAGILYVPIDQGSASVNENTNMQTALNTLAKQRKMQGMIFGGEEALTAFSPDSSFEFVPIKMTKKGIDARAPVYSMPEFEMLEHHVEQMIIGMGEALHGGKIQAKPTKNAGGMPCDYCDYKGLCGYDENEDEQPRDPSASNFREGMESIAKLYKKEGDCNEL